MQLTTPLRSSPKERDSRKAHHSCRTRGTRRDSHPQRRPLPRSSSLCPRTLCILAAQSETLCLHSSTERVPVHSPLLRFAYLVSIPPLTYMLKFSGKASPAVCERGKNSPNLLPCKCNRIRTNLHPNSVTSGSAGKHDCTQACPTCVQAYRHSVTAGILTAVLQLLVAGHQRGPTLRHTLRVVYAFKIPLAPGIPHVAVSFTLRHAFHRHLSQDIHH